MIGLDAIPAHAALARSFCAEQGLTNLKIIEGDAAATGLPGGSFDLAHARLLLVNIPHPERVVAEMARLVRPGGVVALQEGDFTTHCAHPAHPAWNTQMEAFQAVYAAQGTDLAVGWRLPGLLRDAGLVEIDVDAHLAVRPPGHARRTVLVDLVANVTDQIVERGLLSRRELDEATAALHAHLADPETLVVSPLHQHAWARKPASGPKLPPARRLPTASDATRPGIGARNGMERNADANPNRKSRALRRVRLGR